MTRVSTCCPPDKGGASNASGGFCFSRNPNPPARLRLTPPLSGGQEQRNVPRLMPPLSGEHEQRNVVRP
jgi:hypothetical protein